MKKKRKSGKPSTAKLTAKTPKQASARKSGGKPPHSKGGAGRIADIAVIGAGAFGGWTAWHLARRGARVVLVDAWGAGNPRGTSSGESRILRLTYGDKPLYSQ